MQRFQAGASFCWWSVIACLCPGAVKASGPRSLSSGTTGNKASLIKCGGSRSRSGSRSRNWGWLLGKKPPVMEEKAANGLQIDNAQWDADCDAAFELALPPRWEFRDRAWGSPGTWRAFPESVNV